MVVKKICPYCGKVQVKRITKTGPCRVEYKLFRRKWNYKEYWFQCENCNKDIKHKIYNKQ